MLSKLLILLILIFSDSQIETQKNNYTIVFDKIDNKAEIIVNGSIVFTSGTIDNNPNLENDYQIYLGSYLTKDEDLVIVRLYNGHEPYETQADKSWEIKYVLNKDDELLDYVWESGDDNAIGLVFQTEYKL